MRVVKPGTDQVFEIDDSPEEVKTAAAKGYVPTVEVSKDGSSWYEIPGTEEDITTAIGKGYKTKSSVPKPVSELQSAIMGAGQGITASFGDELAGAAGALVDKVKGKEGDLADLYRSNRDQARAGFKAGEEQNPASYMVGQFGGAAATSVIPGMGGASLGKLAAQGAAQGLGSSEADLTEGDVGGAIRDTAIGGATGLAAGGIAKGVSSLAGKAAPAVQNIAEEVATNPTISKVAAVDPAGKIQNISSRIAKDLAPGNPVVDAGVGLLARKATYGIPGVNVAQGISDAAKVSQKIASVTAENLPKLAPRLGKYGKVLQDAATRGAQSLAATDFVLQQTEPEYQKMIQNLQGVNDDE